MFLNKTLIFSFLILFLTGTVTITDVIAEQPVIKVAMAESVWAPFIQVNTDSPKPTGLFPEIIEMLFEKKLNYRVEYHLKPWQRAQNDVKYGKADILITIPTETRKTFTECTDLPVYRLHFSIYTYINHPKEQEIRKIKTIEDIGKLGLSFVSNTGNGWFKDNIAAKGIKTQWVENDKIIAQFLALKRADATIDIGPSFNMIIRQQGLTNKLVQTDVTFGPIVFHILIGKNSPFIQKLPEINAAIKTLTENGSLKEIHNKYQ